MGKRIEELHNLAIRLSAARGLCSSHQAVGNTELLEEKGLDYEKEGSQRIVLCQLMFKHGGMRRVVCRVHPRLSLRQHTGRCWIGF